MNPLGLVIHVLGFLLNATTLVYGVMYLSDKLEVDRFFLDDSKEADTGNGYFFFWSEFVQTVYHLYCLVNDFQGSDESDKTRRSDLQVYRDYFHSMVAFPLGIFSVLSFWGVYGMGRGLVIPRQLDKKIPIWYIHIAHTSPLLFLMLEKIAVKIHYIGETHIGALVTVGLGLLFEFWVYSIVKSGNVWVYPILKVLGSVQLIVFMACQWLFITGMYFLGEALSNTIHVDVSDHPASVAKGKKS